jgi:hypothetical protein
MPILFWLPAIFMGAFVELAKSLEERRRMIEAELTKPQLSDPDPKLDAVTVLGAMPIADWAAVPTAPRPPHAIRRANQDTSVRLIFSLRA